jgi:hypothetical protein
MMKIKYEFIFIFKSLNYNIFVEFFIFFPNMYNNKLKK